MLRLGISLEGLSSFMRCVIELMICSSVLRRTKRPLRTQADFAAAIKAPNGCALAVEFQADAIAEDLATSTGFEEIKEAVGRAAAVSFRSDCLIFTEFNGTDVRPIENRSRSHQSTVLYV